MRHRREDGPACRRLLAARRRRRRRARKADGNDGLPKGWKIFGRPAEHDGHHVRRQRDGVCPGLQTNPLPGVTYYYLFKYHPDRETNPIPEMTGKDLKLAGTRPDFDPQTGQPIVLMKFTGKGSGQVPRHHA